jgi:hypothetical protein
MGLRDRRLQLVGRPLEHANVRAVSHHSPGNEQFDDIGPHLDQLTHGSPGLLRTVDEAIALDADFRTVIAVAVPAGDAQ